MLEFMPILTGGGTSTSTVDWSTIVAGLDFSGITDGIAAVIPVAAPIGLAVIGVFVVWRVLKKFVKG